MLCCRESKVCAPACCIPLGTQDNKGTIIFERISSTNGNLIITNLTCFSLSILNATLQLSNGVLLTVQSITAPFPLVIPPNAVQVSIPIVFPPIPNDVSVLLVAVNVDRPFCTPLFAGVCPACPGTPTASCCSTLLTYLVDPSQSTIIVIPEGITAVSAFVIGGGGSGGTAFYFPDAKTGATTPGGGGGASGQQASTCATVQPGDNISVSIGNGGAPVETAATQGNTGGTTEIRNVTQGNTLIASAAGGGGGGAGTATTGGDGGSGRCGGGGGAIATSGQIGGAGGAGTVESGGAGGTGPGSGGCNPAPVQEIAPAAGGFGGGFSGGSQQSIFDLCLRDATLSGDAGSGGLGQGLFSSTGNNTRTFTGFSFSGAGAAGMAVLLGCSSS